MKLSLLDLGAFPGGGIVSFDYHLKEALKGVGIKTIILSNRKKLIQDERARFDGLKEIIDTTDVLMVSGFFVTKKQREDVYYWVNDIKIPKILMVHGLSEDIESIVSNVKFNLLLTISKNMKEIFERRVGAIENNYCLPVKWIRHPYKRWSTNKNNKPIHERHKIISTARIDFCKNYGIVLNAAERGFIPEYKIHHTGYVHRPCVYFRLTKEVPIIAKDPFTPDGEWRKKYLVEHNTIASFLSAYENARGMIDLTVVKGDGGRSQYTTLEAMDFGIVPIISREWIKLGNYWRDDSNCIGVNHRSAYSVKNAVDKIQNEDLCINIIENGYERLKWHDPEKIALKMLDILNAL